MHTIIIGAGIGGLALAQGLHKAGLSCAVYERDPLNGFRPQGYRLRINPEGSGALRENLTDSTWELFRKAAAITVLGGTNIDAISGEVAIRRPGADGLRATPIGKPEDIYTCDRTVLRGVLMTGLDDIIHYSKVFKSYSTLPNGKVVAEFADGTTAEGDILVGADGVHSLVRRQYIPSHTILDAGGRMIYGKTQITPELVASFHKQGMEWMTIIMDPRPLTLFIEPVRFTQDPALVAPHLPHVADYMYWVLGANQDHFQEDSQLFALSKEQIKELSLTLTDKWSPSIRPLLELQDVSQVSILRVSCAQPTNSAWTPTQVTILGDACHVMPPAGGQGANAALKDALELKKAIVQGGTLAEIGKYEEEMRQRVAQLLPMIEGAGRKMFGQLPFDQLKPIQYNKI